MNLSRLATLAVIFMMVLSAFVAIPAYVVSAESHGEEQHDHDEDDGDHNDDAPDFDDVDENEDGKIDKDEFMVFCPEDVSDEQCTDIFNQFSGDDGLMDEDEYNHLNAYVNSSDNDGDGRDGDFNLANLKVHVQMESLGEWLVTVKGDYPVSESDNYRQEIANMCADMLGTDSSEITQACYDHWANGDHQGGDHGCPPGISEDDCIAMQECQNGGMNMSCMRLMYNYCHDNPNVCDSRDDDNGDNHPDHHDSEQGLHHHGDEDYHHDHDDNDEFSHTDYDRHHSHDDDASNFLNELFAYEAEHVTAEEFLASDGIQGFISEMDISGDGDNPFDSHDYGLYELNTFNAVNGGEVMIEIDFIYPEMVSPTFICGNGDEIQFYLVNDGSGDCDDGADEQWYDSNTPDDTTDDCQEWNDENCEGDEVNWFDCHDGSQVWINSVNDQVYDCEDGEDEGNSNYHSWYGDVFLMEGEVSSEDIGDHLTASEIITRSGHFCDWADENETYTNCMEVILAELVAGSSYTLITKGNCWYEHTSDGEEEVECGTGDYHHAMFDSDSGDHVMNMSGNVTQDSPMADFLDAKTTDNDFGEFVMYHVESFVVGDGGFTGSMTTFGYQCYEWDGNEDCYSSSGMVYVYDVFNVNDTSSGLIGSMASYYQMDEDGIPCPEDVESCSVGHMDMELSPGDYTIVTASAYVFDFTNLIHNEDDSIAKSWSGGLEGNRYDYDDNGNQILVEGDDRLHFPTPESREHEVGDCYDEETGETLDCDYVFMIFAVAFGIADNMTAYEDGEIDAVTAADNIKELIYMMEELGVFDNDGDHDGSHMTLEDFDVSSWDSDNDLQLIVDWFNEHYHYDENEAAMTLDSFLSLCDGISDDVSTDVAQCVLDKAIGMMSNSEHDHDEHDHDDNDSDDNALLDGIVGVQNPEDAGDDCLPFSATIVGSLSDNMGIPIMCSFTFKLTFEGVDETKESHVAHIPFNDDESWTFEFMMLEGYEFIKCDTCEVDAAGIMTGTGSTNITFGKKQVEDPKPECDYVVGLDSTGMAFDPVKLSIKVGETVCWQWKDASMAHNVLELEAEYDSNMNLTNINFGFSSGEPSVTVDFRHTFTEDNMTHYYVCEPHAPTGMVGQIKVGEGLADDPVQQALDDNEVPSIGFVVGSLVLVGAAGLRRRIH